MDGAVAVELLQEPLLFTAAAIVVGLLVGSFLNVVIHRLPRMMERDWKSQCAELMGQEAPAEPRFNLITPSSHCPRCGHAIRPWENIPLLSWLAQRGRCRHCEAPISVRYPIVEALGGLLAGVVAWKLGFGLAGAAGIVLTWALIALAFIDLDTQLLPDDITLPLIWVGLLLAIPGVFVDLQSSVIGAAAGYLSLWSIYQLFKFTTGREGMGYGDFKLLALFGAWFGWQALPLVILLSSVVGALFGIAMILFRGHERSTPIPFGPYLATAGWIAMLWGKPLMAWYLNPMV